MDKGSIYEDYKSSDLASRLQTSKSGFFIAKANYIHQNPVRAGIVEKEEEYLKSSAGDFYGIRKGPIKLSDFG